MSEVLKRVVCVRLAMSESLSRSRRPSAEGPWLHRAGVARRRAGSRRRVAFGRAARADDGPMNRKAAMSSGSLGGGMGSGTAGADGGCPRPLRGLALGLVALSALVVAVPTGAQTVTVPSAPRTFRALAGDGRVRLLWNSPSDPGGVNAETLTYQYRYAPGAAVPNATAWSTPRLFVEATALLAGLANGTAYAFEVRAVNTTGGGTAATATATPQRAACPAPTLGDRRQIWRAALTIGAEPVRASGEVHYFGYDASAWDGSTVGTLSDTEFRVGATRYSIGRLRAYDGFSGVIDTGDLYLAFAGRDLTPTHRAALRLHVCDTAYDFSPDYVFKPEHLVIENNLFPYLWQHGSLKMTVAYILTIWTGACSSTARCTSACRPTPRPPAIPPSPARCGWGRS